MSKIDYKRYKGISKGKWHTCCNNAKYEDPCHCGYVFAGEGMTSVATVHHNDPKLNGYCSMADIVPLAEKQANGRLIEDAPKLLRRCKASDKKLQILRIAMRKVMHMMSDEVGDEHYEEYYILGQALKDAQF